MGGAFEFRPIPKSLREGPSRLGGQVVADVHQAFSLPGVVEFDTIGSQLGPLCRRMQMYIHSRPAQG